MIAHSTGVQPGQFTISFKLSQISGARHVTDSSMNF
jgi:hypothetical protein